jgi:hypothetical protein
MFVLSPLVSSGTSFSRKKTLIIITLRNNTEEKNCCVAAQTSVKKTVTRWNIFVPPFGMSMSELLVYIPVGCWKNVRQRRERLSESVIIFSNL